MPSLDTSVDGLWCKYWHYNSCKEKYTVIMYTNSRPGCQWVLKHYTWHKHGHCKNLRGGLPEAMCDGDFAARGDAGLLLKYFDSTVVRVHVLVADQLVRGHVAAARGLDPRPSTTFAPSTCDSDALVSCTAAESLPFNVAE